MLEKSLASNSCSVVLTWPGKIDTRQIRRLQVAARDGNCWGVMFRDEREAAQASPAELRIRLRPAPGLRDHSRLCVRILKRRGRWESGDILVRLQDQLLRPMPDFSELSADWRGQAHQGNASQEKQEANDGPDLVLPASAARQVQ